MKAENLRPPHFLPDFLQDNCVNERKEKGKKHRKYVFYSINFRHKNSTHFFRLREYLMIMNTNHELLFHESIIICPTFHGHLLSLSYNGCHTDNCYTINYPHPNIFLSSSPFLFLLFSSNLLSSQFNFLSSCP